MRRLFNIHLSINLRRILSARLLLLVFLPMMVLSLLHIHEESHLLSCDECAHNITHPGHFTEASHQSFDCILCQFLSLPYMMAGVVMVALISTFNTVFRLWQPGFVPTTVILSHPLRGPPVSYSLV
ncbi:MAG: hypothetical protein J6S89_00785 [Paludibacteraceae bacterium]|nr:hypothetical protein [Paludibacteraceae bacterium]